MKTVALDGFPAGLMARRVKTSLRARGSRSLVEIDSARASRDKLGSILAMTSTPPPPAVDRTERSANPIVLAVLALVLAAVAAAVWLAPNGLGPTIVEGAVAALALFGALGLLLLAFGLLQFPARPGRSDTAKAIADSSPDGIVVTDRQSRIVYANAAYHALSGARRAEAGRARVRRLAGRVRIGLPPVAGRQVGQIGQRRPSPGAAARRRRRGRVVSHPRPAARGRPAGATRRSGPCPDETREHDRHETFFQDLQHAIDYLDHAPAGFFSAEPDGAIVHMNATLAEWLDYDLAQFGLGRLKVGDIIAGDGGAMLTTMSGRPGEVKTQPFDVDLKPRQGRVLPARILHKVAFSSDGLPGPSRSLVISRAPGEVRGEEDLRAAEVRFARIFNSTPVAIAEVGAGGALLRPNAAFARLAPGALKAAGGDGKPSIFRLVAERDHGALGSALAAAAEGKGRIEPLDVTLEGEEPARSARLFVSAADPASDEGASAIVFALDTTEQRALQENLAQSQKMQAIGQLAGGVAHDFNNVLTAIIGYSDLLLANHRPTDPSFQDIMQIKQNANRAAGLVRQLLAFSRRQTLRPQTLQLNDVLSELQMLLRRLVGEPVALDVVHSRDLWLVKADLNQLEQVIVNLVVNARDAMPDGGKITLRTRNVHAGRMRELQGRQRRPRRLRAGRGAGHRARHPARGQGQDLRAVLHHQGGRQGHRPRPVDGLRHRQADRRLCAVRQRAGQGRDLPHPAAAPHRSGERGAGQVRKPAKPPGRPHRPRRHPAGRGRGGGARLRRAGARPRAATRCSRPKRASKR